MIKKARYVIPLLLFVVINSKFDIINIPCLQNMQEFQIDLFTICSVLAGFSFTVMGLLTTLLSSELTKKLENTSFVTNKSKFLLRSVVWFGVPAVLSILFFTGIIDWICVLVKCPIIREILFVSQIGCLFIGFLFFFRATKGVYLLIQKIYGIDEIKMKKKKDEFNSAFKKDRQ